MRRLDIIENWELTPDQESRFHNDLAALSVVWFGLEHLNETVRSCEEDYAKYALALLRQASADIRYAADRIREWPSPPDPSLVAAWAPLLSEKLSRIEEILTRCEYRLKPPPPRPLESEDEIRPGMPMHEVERIHITQTLRVVGGNRGQAAGLLEIGDRTLYRKLNEYGIR